MRTMTALAARVKTCPTQTCLEEHADDGHHRQPSVGQLCCELRLLFLGIIGRENLPSEITRGTRSAGGLVLGCLAVRAPEDHLGPACDGNLGNGCKASRHIGELDAQSWGKVAGPLGEFRGNITHCCEHGNSSVLKLRLTSASKVLRVTVLREACRIPESNWRLHTQLALESAQRRGCVIGPISPGAAGEAILQTGPGFKAPIKICLVTTANQRAKVPSYSCNTVYSVHHRTRGTSCRTCDALR